MSDAEPRTVVIVDDDDAVRDSLRFLLEIAGYAVSTFASAPEFLKSKVHHVACLILDHHMPDMTGLELVERLRADGNSIPIVLITGSPSSAIVACAASLGVERVLQKPLREQDLLDFINMAMS